ncbi:MAG: hypothetical protein ACRC5C_02845 [Bacilli bacterium]
MLNDKGFVYPFVLAVVLIVMHWTIVESKRMYIEVETNKYVTAHMAKRYFALAKKNIDNATALP